MGPNMLDRRDAKLRQQAYIDNQINGQSVQQLVFDAAMIALHEEFGFGRDRCLRFRAALQKHLDDMCDLILKDTDPDALYSRDTIDRKLREIIGDELIPWEQRYKAQINPARNRAERRAQKRRIKH